MSQNQLPVSERIKDLFQHFGDGNLSAFARLVGVSAQAIRDLMKGEKGGPSWPVLQNILHAFPAIATDWLLFGQGEMLKSAATPKTSALHSADGPRIVAAAEGDNTGAPIYNLRTAANYRGLGLSQEQPEPDGVITLPSWLLRRGDHAVFPVIGDSMEPTFFAKDYVLCRFLPKSEWEHLREDTVAVVVSESRGLQLKRLTFRAGEEYVRCRSDNRQHPAYNLDLEEVFEVWRFEWRITANAHNPTEGLSERVSTVEDSLEDMRILLEQVLDEKALTRLAPSAKS